MLRFCCSLLYTRRECLRHNPIIIISACNAPPDASGNSSELKIHFRSLFAGIRIETLMQGSQSVGKLIAVINSRVALARRYARQQQRSRSRWDQRYASIIIRLNSRAVENRKIIFLSERGRETWAQSSPETELKFALDFRVFLLFKDIPRDKL